MQTLHFWNTLLVLLLRWHKYELNEFCLNLWINLTQMSKKVTQASIFKVFENLGLRI